MRRSIGLVPPLVLALCAAQPATAQDSAIPRGSRVRVMLPDGSRKPFVGTVDSIAGGTLWMRARPAGSTAITLAQVVRLEVSHGRYRPTWSKIAPLWLTLGAGAIGASAGYAFSSDDDFFGREFGAFVGGVLAGGTGLIVGTGLAIGVKTDRWEAVPVGSTSAPAPLVPSVYVAPSSGGVKLGVRAKF